MPRVAIVKGDAYSATSSVLRLLRFKKLVKDKSNIVIKPNLTTAAGPNEGITTDVNVVRAILDQIPEIEKVTIAEGPGGADTEHAFGVNGYLDLAKEYGIELIDVNSDEYTEISLKKPLCLQSIKMSKTIFESDFLISVAKLKVHSIAGVTLSLKNMMGACPKEQKLKIHALIPYSLVDLVSAKLPDFGIIDGIVGNEIDECVPHPVRMDIILGSDDCIALDVIASETMGINFRDVPYLWILAKKCGILDVDEIEVLGEQICNVKKKFRKGGLNPRSDRQKVLAYLMLKTGTFDFFYRCLERMLANERTAKIIRSVFTKRSP